MTERHDPYVSLRNPNFRWYVASSVAFTLGAMIQAVVVAWQVYALTKDPLSLGLVGLAEALPFISAALYAGHVADRHNRKRLAMTSMAVQTLCAVALLALTLTPGALHAGRIWPIYGVMLVSGLARSFQTPVTFCSTGRPAPLPRPDSRKQITTLSPASRYSSTSIR